MKDIGIGGCRYKAGDEIDIERNFGKILISHKIVEAK